MNDTNQEYSEAPKGSLRKTLGILAVALTLFVANAYLFRKIDNLGKHVTQGRTSMLSEIGKLREAHAADIAAQDSRLASLAEQIGAAHRRTAVVASRSNNEIKKTAERLVKLSEEQRKQQQQLASELTEVKEVATSANTRIAGVSGEVTTVKADVAATRTELGNTVADLRRVTGDMGVMSGLIATNGRELTALRELGERNYFEFNVARAKTPQRVGDIRLVVKKTDPKRNKYTIELYADDKRVEKKDRTINEPVQFYVSHSRQPYELVVNEVRLGRLVGYLATPKAQIARK
ncbi:MAG: hypothetical protein AAB225_27200 [Acidobacteriota bacterium]